MRKKLFAIMMLASVLFAAFSCKNDEVEEPTLTLSDVSVQLPKAASEKAITVTTNQTEWTALANADWIHLTQSGNTLTIKVDENLTAEKRMGEVAVLAVIGKKVVVEQEGSDVSIVAMPDKLEVDQWGGKFQFDVDANIKDWTVTTDADWLTVTPKQFKGEVLLEVAENTERESRVAKLILKSSDNKGAKEFTITQSGIMYLIMPYLEIGASLGKTTAFEEARRSELIPDINYIFGGPYTFQTKSPAFPIISYTFADSKLSGATMNSSLKKADLQSKDVDKMFTDNEFKLKSESDIKKVYQNEKETYILEATINLVDNGLIQFVKIPKQPKPYPTFEKFPYGLIDFGTADATAITNWEAANGGKLNVTLTNTLGVDTYDAPQPWVNRIYWLTDKAPFVLDQTAHAFENLNLGLFEDSGMHYLTNEFKALLEKEGFIFLLERPNEFFYYRKDIQLVLLVRPFQNAIIADGDKVLFFNMWKEEVDVGSKNIKFKNFKENELKFKY